jgi:hypothetical protein
MAERMSHAARMDRLRDKQAISRPRNSALKRKERQRRETRLVQLLKAGQFPYTPAILTWLSERLGKSGAAITAEDVQAYLAKAGQ